jgi:hypothetical protein
VPPLIIGTPLVIPTPGDTVGPLTTPVAQNAVSPDGRYYVVSVGREVGVFTNWYVSYSFLCLIPLTSALVSMPPP